MDPGRRARGNPAGTPAVSCAVTHLSKRLAHTELAEGEGFEPPETFRPRRFSKLGPPSSDTESEDTETQIPAAEPTEPASEHEDRIALLAAFEALSPQARDALLRVALAMLQS